LLSDESLALMAKYETIGVGTTVAYPEAKRFLDYWVTTSILSITPQHPHNKVNYLMDGDFDKYFCVTEHNAKDATEWCREIPRVRFYRDALQSNPKGTFTLRTGTSIVAACALAKHLGADECVLTGSDFIKNRRTDGSMISGDIKIMGQKAQEGIEALNIAVYKTNPESPIDLEVFLEN